MKFETVTITYSQHWLIRPKIRKEFWSNLAGCYIKELPLTLAVSEVCPEGLVELSRLVELPVVELTGADCIAVESFAKCLACLAKLLLSLYAIMLRIFLSMSRISYCINCV